VAGDVERELGLPHRWTSGEHHQVAAAKPARDVVHVGEAARQAAQAAAVGALLELIH
jgi:hypothetical protein